jgi:hypothetical protein
VIVGNRSIDFRVLTDYAPCMDMVAFLDRFPDQTACIAILRVRWPAGPLEHEKQ